MVSFYAVMAFLSISIVQNGIYYKEFEYYSPDILMVTPFILCFLSYFIFFQPLRQISQITNLCESLFSNKLFNGGLKIWIVAMIIRTAIKFTEAAITISSGMADAYESRHLDGEMLFQYSPIVTKFLTHTAMIGLATVPIVMFYALSGIVTKKISKFYAIFLMIVCFAHSILNSIGMGSRGSLFMDLFSFLFFVLLFWRYFDKKSKKLLATSVLSVLAISITYMWAISIDRAGNATESAWEKIARYFGEPFPNLGFQIWGKVQNHPMGDRMFLLKTFSPSYTPFDQVLYWRNFTGVRTYIFKTLFGDFYIEYGVALGLVLICLIAMSFYFFIKKFGTNVTTLPLIYFYFQICVYSFAGQTKQGRFAIVQLFYVFIFMVIMHFILPRKHRNL
jgi:oligosaccharide repeat unit polymerase